MAIVVIASLNSNRKLRMGNLLTSQCSISWYQRSIMLARYNFVTPNAQRPFMPQAEYKHQLGQAKSRPESIATASLFRVLTEHILYSLQ